MFLGVIDLDLQGQIHFKIKIYPILSLWVCPCHKSPLIEVRIFKFWPKMHLSTVKVPIDFGIDWPWSSVLFSISNQLFFSKLCVSHSFASFCIYLVRPSPVSVPHATWHRTYTDSHECGQGPTMDRETVYLYILVRSLEFQPASTLQLALDFTSCYRFSPYYICFACRNFICQH